MSGKKPERVPVDADYVMKIAKTVHETFRPQITFARDPRGEEIAQAVAFVLLTEKRFQDMGLKTEERTAIIQAALRILADGNARAAAAARELAAPFVANAAEAAKPAEGHACEVVPLRKISDLILDELLSPRDVGPMDENCASCGISRGTCLKKPLMCCHLCSHRAAAVDETSPEPEGPKSA